ncbi:MAG TPA: ABC transporter permease [Gemmatimonadaceae bacterium]|nr:ABC transporter permease [Gemmatimonadaceae bacterium]
MNARIPRGPRPTHEAVVRLLIRLYPPEFRDRYERELVQLVRAAWLERRRSTRTSHRLAFWLGVTADLAAGAVRERVAELRDHYRERERRRRELIHGARHRHSTQGDGMGTLAQDIRYAWRTIRKSPGVALVVVVSLALGIGANTLIYSVVDGIVLRPFPYPDAHRVVSFAVTYPATNGERRFIEAISPPEYNDILANVKSVEKIFAFDLGNRNISGGDQPERVFTGFIWGDPMASIGVRPALGRGFHPDETTRPGEPIAIISHRIWQSRFGGDSSIVGRTVHVNGQPTEVIGVMPPGFLLIGTDLWLPMATDPAGIPRDARQWTLIGRLRDGVTLAQANAEVRALAGRIEREYVAERKEYAGWRIEVDTWTNALVGEYRPAARLLLGAVGLVLLIACANIASLLLARATARQREIAVRRALGAGQWRISRQLFTESVLLAILGGVLGLGLAFALLGPTTSLFPEQLRTTGVTATVNGRVLLYTLGAAVLSGLLFGVAPALQGVRGGSREWLTGEGAAGRLTTSAGGRRLRSAFVVAEIALSLMLLVGAGILVRSFARLQAIDPGFDTRNVLTMRISLPREQYESNEVGTFFDEVSRRLAATPGVRVAGAATQFPPGNAFTTLLTVEGQDAGSGGQLPTVDITNVAGDYFGALGYTLESGRLLTTNDNATSPLVAVVNESTARRFLGAGSPVGKRIALGRRSPPQWVEVVGVVGDVRNRGLATPPSPEVFVPVHQELAGWNNQLFLTIRTATDPLALLPAVRRTIESVDAQQPLYSIRTLDGAFAEAVSQRRAAMQLLTIFAGIALALAAVGIYGLMSHMVNERTHEIGIRMALGAARGDVLRLVMRQTMVLVAIGTLLGLAGALGLGRALSGLAFGVAPSDPATLSAVTILLAAVALAAALVPARRAARVDPLLAMRAE